MNPYLTTDNTPSEILRDTLDYYGISIDEFKEMSDNQVIAMVKRFSDVLNDGRDSGSFSRYFDLDAWARENGFPEPDLFGERKQSPVDTFPFLIVSKVSKREKNKRLDGCIIRQSIGGGGTNNTSDNVCGKFGSIKAPAQNSHPTVKPLKLMHYLITLTTREGDLVVDPYVGSGTVSLAAKQLGRHFIGIEISEAYSEIARTRLAQEVLKL